MREVLYEESAVLQNQKSGNTKYYIFYTLSILMFFFFGFQIFLLLFFTRIPEIEKGNIVLNIISLLVPIALSLTLAIVFLNLKNRFVVDYDYIFVSGSIRVSKVIKNFKRKFVIKFETSNIEKLGLYDSETYNQYLKVPGIKKTILTLNSTPEEGKDFYYMVVNVNDTKNLLIFECKELFIVNVLQFSNKAIIEPDFAKNHKKS